MPIPLPTRTVRRARASSPRRAGTRVVADQRHGGQDVARRRPRRAPVTSPDCRAHADRPAVLGGIAAGAVTEAEPAAVGLAAVARAPRDSAPDPPTGWPGGRRCMRVFHPTRSAVASSCVGGPRLRAHPRERRLEPLVGEVRVEQLRRRGEELARQLDAGQPGAAPEPHRCRPRSGRGRGLERRRRPARCGRPSRRRTRGRRRRPRLPQTARDRRARAVEVDVEGDRVWSPNGAKPHGSRSE